MNEPRFFVDHGMIHDRETGRHVFGEDRPNPIEEALEILNTLHQKLKGCEAERDDLGRKLRDTEIKVLREVLERYAHIPIANDYETQRDQLLERARELEAERDQFREQVKGLREALEGIDAYGTMAPMDDHETLLDVLKIAREALENARECLEK